MIVNVDAKSLEWCTYLYLSQDPVGIEEWEGVVLDPDKNDIHTANQTAFNLPSRLVAKVFLFRWIYRGSAYAYSKDPDFASVSKKVDFWQEVIDKYYKKYAKLYKTHMQYIREATTKGKLVSPFGREYQFAPHKNYRGESVWSEPDITNWINQGCGADVMAVARVVAFQRMKRAGFKSKLISTVHDSIVADCPDNEVEDVSVLFDKVFRDLPQLVTKAYGVDWNVSMLGEVSVGKDMLNLKEIKF
jgi:DNA polymerase I-like protein with 3'-5' exonuclease and polymerase domains